MTLSSIQRSLLSAVGDTLVPALDPPQPGVAQEYFERSASDRGITEMVAEGVGLVQPHVRAAVLELLEHLRADGFLSLADTRARTERLHGVVWRSAGTRLGFKQLKAMTFGLLVARFDERDQNPDWGAIGYPGPASAPPSPAQAPKTIPLLQLASTTSRLQADVCVIGSGAGGSVIASELARSGRSVLVLEEGGYRNESDFRQLELLGITEMFLAGGVMWSDTGSLALMAGATLGGGTVVNSLACLRPPDIIRETWARIGLDGLDTPAFDAHLAAVSTRLGVNTDATKHNRQAELMLRGLDARGMSYELMPRNASLDDDERICGYCNSGCQLGCKQSTLLTYLQDAADCGARFLVNCRADRVVVENGRAAAVEARVIDRSGAAKRVTVHAPEVVVAAGSLESPAILLRSGIGGPAVGRHLQVHPAYFVSGVYDDVVNAWSGQIVSAVSFDRAYDEDGGFLIENLGLSPALSAGSSPWTDGRRHREALRALPHTAAWAAICHDHGEGRVVLGLDGHPLVRWELDDPIDRRAARRAHVELALIHHAAGAREIYTFGLSEQRWHRGQDFAAFVKRLAATPIQELTPSSAHQMSSCRMGDNRHTSVADGRGELHDVPGVWIGDASALPTAPGVNPMITIMALARRTAAHMVAS